MSPETAQLQCLVEEAAWRYEASRTERNRMALKQAWADYNEAYATDVRHQLIAADSPDVP